MAASNISWGIEDHFSALLSSLKKFQDSGSYTDLTLQTEGGQVRCHKAVLAPFSPLLWDICHTVEEVVIILPGVALEVVQQLVSQFYTGCVNNSEHTVALARVLKLDIQLGSVGKCNTEDKRKKETEASWTEDFLGFIGEQSEPLKPLIKEDKETVIAEADLKSVAMFFNCQLCDKSEKFVSNMRTHYCRSHLLRDLRAECNNQTDGTRCKICGKPFTRKSNLYCHIAVKHNMLNDILMKRGLQPLPKERQYRKASVTSTDLKKLRCKEKMCKSKKKIQEAHDGVTLQTKEEVELAFAVVQNQVKKANKLCDKAEKSRIENETSFIVQGEEVGDGKLENVSSLGMNKDSQVKLQRPRKLLDGTPVEFQTEEYPTQYIERIKLEPVLTRPDVKPQHPYSQSQEMQEHQELTPIENGDNYKVENYNYEDYKNKDCAMMDTGGKQNKELPGYVMSNGIGHNCSSCGRSFKNVKNCKRHIREKHLGFGKSVCPHCNLKFSIRYIKNHMVTCKHRL